MDHKPHIIKAILSSLLTLIVFGLVYILSFLILGGIIYVLSIIPIINKIVDLLFYFRGDTPDIMLILLSTIIAYAVGMEIQERINKDYKTIGLSCIFSGSCFVIIHGASLFINIIYGSGVFANIIQIIAGIVFIVHGRSCMTENSSR